ncbi:hypothetical protein Tco_1078140 [Tanacetum coccineum]
MMSSPNHSTSDIEDAFSSMNILNYTSVSSDYFPASSGSISFNSSENSNIIPSVISPLYFLILTISPSSQGVGVEKFCESGGGGKVVYGIKKEKRGEEIFEICN